jgi:hypothetical protein
MPDLSSLTRPPYIFLIVGAIFLSAAVVWTYMGKAWIRFYGWAYRAKEPKRFWWEVAMYSLVGVCFIARFLYEVSGLSN